VPYRPAPGIAVYYIRVDDYVVMAAEHDLAGPLLDLVTAVMALVAVTALSGSTVTEVNGPTCRHAGVL